MSEIEESPAVGMYPKIAKGCSGKKAILFFHGFGGSPVDIEPLRIRLEKKGFCTYAPYLIGHGTSPKHLQHVGCDEWISQAISWYDMISKSHRESYVVGFSLGGALGLIVAENRPLKKLAVINPFFRVTKRWYVFPNVEWWANSLKGILPYVQKWEVGQINDPSGIIEYHGAYLRIPLSSVKELSQAASIARNGIGKISASVLWVHSRGDMVSDYTVSKDVFESLPGSQKEFVEFERSNHVLLYDFDKESAMEAIENFFSGG